MASKKKPGIGRISKKRRTVKSYVGPDVAKAMEAVGIPYEDKVSGTQAALDAIAAQLALLVAAAEKLVARASEPVERKTRKAREPVQTELPLNHEAHVDRVVEKSLPAAPSLDELRAAAVAYAGKHGKEQLVALLQKYNPEGKLSTIPEVNLSACLAAMKMGMVD